MKELSEYRKRPHWSFSSLNLFMNICSLQWAFRYKYKVNPSHTPVALAFGTSFHAGAEFIANHRKYDEETSVEDVQDFFSESWLEQCAENENIKLKEGEDKNSLNDKGRDMMKCLYEKWENDEEVVDISKAFCVPIQDRAGLLVCEKPLIGEIDLVVKSKHGNTILVDWKSSKNRWPATKADKDLQATAFLYAYNSSLGFTESFRYDVVTKTKTPTYTQNPTKRCANDYHRFAEFVRVVEQAVAGEIFIPNESSFSCGDCQYATACKAWHKDRAKTILTPAA